MRDFAKALAGGDRRSIGRADAAVAAVTREPQCFGALWDCLKHPDPLVRMRAADALEKISRTEPSLFAAHKKELLGGALDDGTVEVRWNLIAIAPRLRLTAPEAKKFCAYLDKLLHTDPSRIVKVTALQAAFDLSRCHSAVCDAFHRMLDYARASSWPSLRVRARKLSDVS